MSAPFEIAIGITVEVMFVAAVAALIYRLWGRFLPLPHRCTILAFQRGVVLRHGAPERVLGTGSHWISPSRSIMVCDVRPRPFQVPAVELLTSDGMSFRLGIGGEYRIADPVAYLTESTDAGAAFYLEVRQMLRASVSEVTSRALLAEQTLLTVRMKELLEPCSSHLGLTIEKLDVWEAVPLGWLRQV